MSTLLFLTLISQTSGQLPPPKITESRSGPRVVLLPPVVDEHRVSSSPAAKRNEVLFWNAMAVEAVRHDRTAPPLAARNLAIVHVAIYDAVNAVERTHSPYLVDVRPATGTSAEAAAAAAAHHALSGLYPRQQKAFDAALATSLAEVRDGSAREGGIHLGRFVAAKVLERRVQDIAALAGKHTARRLVGIWQPTPPAFGEALLPGWINLEPFGIREGVLPRPAGPPALNSAAYAVAFREVKALGGKASAARTPEQTEIARFWADGDGTSTPCGHWNNIARDLAMARGLSLGECARLFALLNISLGDAGLACWIIKFHHEVWRPVTGIHLADQDGNPDTAADPSWEPLLPTPPFPAYTSGHSTFSGAAATILARFFETDAVRFETTSEGLPGVKRSFESFSAAAEEAGRSRIYGGIHWEFDNRDGLINGRAVGDFVWRNHLRRR